MITRHTLSRLTRFVAVALPILAAGACRDLVGSASLPAGTQGPNTYNTPAGALGMYRGAHAALADVIRTFTVTSGELTDELTAAGLGSGPLSIGGQGAALDERVQDNSELNTTYSDLQLLRGTAMQAIGLLSTYAPETSPALRGEMYALEGYGETMLAELYCSGIPLSTLDFQGDFTYAPGSSTVDVYAHALALFDSALAISSDSARTMWLASIGKGRVLMSLGQYAEAAQAVAAVPDTFVYQVTYGWGLISFYPFGFAASTNGGLIVASSEGGNGVPYYTVSGNLITSNDPRSWVTFGSPATNNFGLPQLLPVQYPK